MRHLRSLFWATAICGTLALPSTSLAQGIYLPGAGAVHGSMGGASTATPLDAIGALYWNPAAIGRLGRSEASIGGNVLFPDIGVSSSFPRPDGSIASGRTRSDNGVGLTSSIGIVHQPDESRLTYGLGLFTLGGGGVNYPGDPGNPILSPVGPVGQNYVGSIYSSLTMFQLAPTVSYKVTDRLVVGFGPTIDISMASFNPAFFASPNQVVGPDRFSSATHSRPFWGGGFRVGLVYSLTDHLDLGFGYTSQQWLEQWKFNASNARGEPRELTLDASLPAIYSWGLAYRGFDRCTLAVDMRYFDYANSELFGTPVPEGGLGWDSVFSIALGAHYQVTQRVAVMGGYQYNTNPIPTTATLFNIQAPAFLQNTISVGSTYNFTDCLSLSLGYALSFENSITGTAREIPGAGITMTASNQSMLFNIGIKFGGGTGRKSTCGPVCEPCAVMAESPTLAPVTAIPQQLPQ